MDFKDESGEAGKEVTLSAPKLSAIDKLYVRSYLSTLSHKEAHKFIKPTLKTHHEVNEFSKKDAIQFHISVALQDKLDTIKLSPEVILERLFKEATREGGGSNHAARVTALTTLGKHFNMFSDRKENIVPVIQVVNYSTPLEIKQDIPETEVLEERDVDLNYLETLGIKVNDYSDV